MNFTVLQLAEAAYTYRYPLGVGPMVLLTLAAAVAAVVLYGWPIWSHLRRRGGEVPTLDNASARDRVVLLLLRGAAVAMLAWLLAGPSAWQERPRQAYQQQPQVILAFDRSASMSVDDAMPSDAAPDAAPITRWDAVLRHWTQPDFIRELEAWSMARWLVFDQAARGVSHTDLLSMEPDGAATHIYDLLHDVSRGEYSTRYAADMPTGGFLVLLSDGHDTSGRSGEGALDRLRQNGWRVFTVPVGDTHGRVDVSVRAWADSVFLADGQSTQINVALGGTGAAGRRVEVDLLKDGRRTDTRVVELDAQSAGQTRFRVTPRAEDVDTPTFHAYQVVARPLPEEVYLDNNQRHVFIESSRLKMRVLLVEGEPYWDTRFLLQALRTDAQIDLTTVHALGPQRQVIARYLGTRPDDPTGPAATADRDWRTLREFDLVILGRGVERFFPGDEAQRLVDFVERQGGSVILARGNPFNPQTREGARAHALFRHLEPVVWSEDVLTNLRLRLTEAGRQSPVTQFDMFGPDDVVLRRLPSMLAATRIDRAKAATIVLADQVAPGDAPPMAALAYINAPGGGRVLSVLSDGMWRWAFLPADLHEYDTIYQVFWSRAVRWLLLGGDFLPGQDVQLNLSRTMLNPRQPLQIEVATRYVEAGDIQADVRVIAPNGESHEVLLSRTDPQSPRMSSSFSAADSGVYRVELTYQLPGQDDPTTLEKRFAVYDESAELFDQSARRHEMEAIAHATGGECLDIDDTQRLLEVIRQFEIAEQADGRLDDIIDRSSVPLWILALLGVEWFFRRRRAMA